MRCYICDRVLDDENVQYNELHKDYDPCPTCLAVIEDLCGFGDRPTVTEDEFGDDLLDELSSIVSLDDLYPLLEEDNLDDFT